MPRGRQAHLGAESGEDSLPPTIVAFESYIVVCANFDWRTEGFNPPLNEDLRGCLARGPFRQRESLHKFRQRAHTNHQEVERVDGGKFHKVHVHQSIGNCWNRETSTNESFCRSQRICQQTSPTVSDDFFDKWKNIRSLQMEKAFGKTNI